MRRMGRHLGVGMSKHTQGPWTLFPRSELGGPIVQRRNEGGFEVRGLSHESEDADACLIAAAPELLEALVKLEEAFCNVGPGMTREDRADSRAALIAARAAIAKAVQP